MDYSRLRLDRIMQVAASQKHCTADGKDNLRFVGEGGETFFHSLLALHTTSEVIQEHLRRKSDIQEEEGDVSSEENHSAQANHSWLLNQDKSGATVLHVAIHRNSWHLSKIVKMLLLACPELVSTPMICGTYPLHVLTGQTLTIPSQVFQQILQAAPYLASAQDRNGDTPLSLLYKNVLRFRWARNWELMGQAPPEYTQPNNSSSISTGVLSHKDLSTMTIIAPTEYLDYSIQLLEACHNQKNKNLSWHTICATDRCPPLLVRMLLHQLHSQHHGDSFLCRRQIFRDRDKNGRLPLHYAAKAEAVSTRLLPLDCSQRHWTVVEIILSALPAAASIMDNTGRLPLHYAVANTTLVVDNESDVDRRDPLKAVLSLARTCPTALSVPDPVTRLYPVLRLASLMDATNHESNMGGHQLDVLYRLLRANPSICKYHLANV